MRHRECINRTPAVFDIFFKFIVSLPHCKISLLTCRGERTGRWRKALHLAPYTFFCRIRGFDVVPAVLGALSLCPAECGERGGSDADTQYSGRRDLLRGARQRLSANDLRAWPGPTSSCSIDFPSWAAASAPRSA